MEKTEISYQNILEQSFCLSIPITLQSWGPLSYPWLLKSQEAKVLVFEIIEWIKTFNVSQFQDVGRLFKMRDGKSGSREADKDWWQPNMDFDGPLYKVTFHDEGFKGVGLLTEGVWAPPPTSCITCTWPHILSLPKTCHKRVKQFFSFLSLPILTCDKDPCPLTSITCDHCHNEGFITTMRNWHMSISFNRSACNRHE